MDPIAQAVAATGFAAMCSLFGIAAVLWARSHFYEVTIETEQHERMREALQWFSNMLDGREHLPRDQRTEITYGELWKAREALEP